MFGRAAEVEFNELPRVTPGRHFDPSESNNAQLYKMIPIRTMLE